MVKHTNAHGGILSEEDLQNYTAVWRDPIVFNYKDLKVFSMPLHPAEGYAWGNAQDDRTYTILAKWDTTPKEHSFDDRSRTTPLC